MLVISFGGGAMANTNTISLQKIVGKGYVQNFGIVRSATLL